MRATTRQVVGGMLTILGLVAAGLVAFLLAFSSISNGRSQDQLYAEFREELRLGTAPVGASIDSGEPVAILEIDRIGHRSVVIEGAGAANSQRGPGHVSSTPLPGQPGISVVLGRRTTFGAPFRRLDALEKGDKIRMHTGQGKFTFTVDSIRSTDRDATAPKSVASRLTLVTSDPAYTPTHSLVVSAALDGDAAIRTSLASRTAAAERPLQADPSAVTRLFLWCLALALVASGIALLWRRIPNPTLWVAAAPLTLAIAWNAGETIAALLPNTL